MNTREKDDSAKIDRNEGNEMIRESENETGQFYYAKGYDPSDDSDYETDPEDSSDQSWEEEEDDEDIEDEDEEDEDDY